MNDDETRTRLANLRVWNLGVGAVHLVQAVVILAISATFAIPVVANVQTGPPTSGAIWPEITRFFDVNFALVIAVFLLLAAVDHLLTAGPLRRWYEANLLRGINYARWIEYSVSSSLMIILIGLLTGITNLYAVLAIFGVNSSMILFGLLMERVNLGRERVDWWPFVFGCIAGIVPWIAITVSIIVSSAEGDGVPGFVYGIFVSLFLLFNCFALNQWLQYRRKGRFADYLYGEKVYLVLSLVAKSALAWQVYAGTLAD
jgi:hypothetical protein